ncbi:MAG: acetyl xylan esterase [Oligoflexales bacterium]|nr:acetyl xylan esterase [Oligoflexales bacterium]
MNLPIIAIFMISLFFTGCFTAGSGKIHQVSIKTGAVSTYTDVRYVGRFADEGEGKRFSWAGSAIEGNFSGREIAVRLRDFGHNHFTIIIDGKVTGRLVTDITTERYVLARNLSGGKHQVILVKNTEPLVGETLFRNFELEDGGRFLDAPPPKARRIEFIGDSITCAFGNEGKDASCPFSPDTENIYSSFGAITSRHFDADATFICWSGRGVYRNYEGDETDPLPAIYGRILPAVKESSWSFPDPQPDIFVVNLGTNDFAQGVPPVPVFIDAYKKFVMEIRSRSPDSHIFIAVGPILDDKPPHRKLTHERNYVKKVVDSLKTAGDKKVYFIEFPYHDQKKNGEGCSHHPSHRTHEQMAENLIGAIEMKTGWKHP